MELFLRKKLKKNILTAFSFTFISASALFCADDNADELLSCPKGKEKSCACRELLDPLTKRGGYKHSISFSGGSFYYLYEFGVAAYLQKNYDLSDVCFIGASAGALTSTFLACDIDIEKDVMGVTIEDGKCVALDNNADSWISKVYAILQKKPTGAYFNISNVMFDADSIIMKAGAYKKATGRATFSLTNVSSFWPFNERVNSFYSNNDLARAGFASCQLPFLVNGNLFAKFGCQTYADGGFTDYQPVFNNETIKVSPYMWSPIWGGKYYSPLSWLSLYGTTSMGPGSRNWGLFEDGYNDAKKHRKHWKDLKKHEKHWKGLTRK